MLLGAPSFADPWRFQTNPEVYLLVAFLIGAFLYAVRKIGPHAVPPGRPAVTRGNVVAFVAAMAMLFFASTWPIHQIGEEYLYSIHMLQHMMLSYFLPPLVLLATPEWLLRLLVGSGRGYRVLRTLCQPVVAALAFNGMVMITHIPGVVNASVQNAVLHYSLHLLIVITALWMWMPVCGPFKEWRLTPIGTTIYLFCQSLVPTIPAGWLTFAEGTVYRQYLQPVRVWGLSVTEDQQLAGGIMKTGGGVFLWAIIVYIVVRKVGVDGFGPQSYRRSHRMPDAEIVGNDEYPLTYQQVTEAFERSPAEPEPRQSPR